MIAMEPVELDPRFRVCPECGGDTVKIDDKWKCKNCDYEEEAEER